MDWLFICQHQTWFFFQFINKESSPPLPRIFCSCAHRAENGQRKNENTERKCGYDSHSSQMSRDTLVLKQSIQLSCQVHWPVLHKVLSNSLRGELESFVKREMPVGPEKAITFLHSAPEFIYCIGTVNDKFPVLMRLPSQVPSLWRNIL